MTKFVRLTSLTLLAVLTSLIPVAFAPTARGAALPVTFLEVSSSLGVAQPAGSDTWGLATADWDGDGCDDLYVGLHTQNPVLYRSGCPGVFVNETGRLNLDALPRKTTKDRHSPAWGDYDGDDRLDLFVPTGGGRGTGTNDDQLFHQLAPGNFQNVAPDLGITDPEGSGRFGMWVEYNGKLALFVGHFLHPQRPEANRHILYEISGGVFTNVAAAAGINALESAISGAAVDLDLDGDLDIIAVPGTRASLYTNDGDGTYAFSSLGVGSAIGAAVADFDGAGDPEIYLTRRPRARLLPSIMLKFRGGQWIRITPSTGTGFPLTLSALPVDVDNDGDLDLFVTTDADSNGVNQPNLLLLNDGTGVFVERGVAAGVAGPSDGAEDMAAWGDFNRDGFIDLVVSSRRSGTPILLYLNQGNSNHWLTMRFRDPSRPNRLGIGVKMWATIGTQTLYRELDARIAYKTQSALYIHLGLGAATKVDQLVVEWPGGARNTFLDVAGDTHYLLVKGGSPSPLVKRSR